ncbi:MAG: DUF928 domain-containing protein [Prochloron sp. SP5CPC1]|nr:DUF928 domain-containing protein [Candidatus Paraprochloron terpiosi SP5CPC1]
MLLTGLVVKQGNELILPPLYKLSFQPLLAEDIKDLRETDKLGQQRQEATRSGVITKGKGKLTALVPKVKWDEETEIVFGKTISAHPTFFFYLPYEPTTPPKNVKFKLLNEEEHEVYTTLKQFNNLPGVVSISIPETAPPLEVGQNYYWSLYFIHDDKKRSQDDYLSGWVKRVEPSLALKSKLATATTPWELLPFYTEESLWIDALSALALLRRHPYNPSIQEVLRRYPLNPPPSRG